MKETTILVLSDIHGDVEILKRIVETVRHDYSVLAGDFCCSDSLVSKYVNYVVRGNNDFDSSLRDSLDFEIEGISFHLEHGHFIGSYFQLDNYQYMHKVLRNKECDILIHGHTHIPKIFDYEDGIVLCPGSTTYPRGGSRPSYAIITIDKDKNVECKIVNL